jgi:hypothetical protein
MQSSYQFAANESYLSSNNRFLINIETSSLKNDFILSDVGSSNINRFNSLLSIAVALGISDILFPEAYLTMIASEKILKKDWDTIEEDEAWVDL